MEVVYYDPSNHGSFGGIASLTRQTRSSEVRKWLSTQDTYTLHKPVRRIFPRRKTFAKGIDDLFQADLADMQNLSRYNDGYRFILTCVDVFSKRAFAIPLKDKRGTSVAEVFEQIFRGRVPVFLQSDRGSEFWVLKCKTFSKSTTSNTIGLSTMILKPLVSRDLIVR